LEGNTDHIIQAYQNAKAARASLRVGPDLETCGYDCRDTLLEDDTSLHLFQLLARIIQRPNCQDILVDVGIPVRHRNVRQDCGVLVYNGKVLGIWRKMAIAEK